MSAEWINRETTRFASGQYKPLPFDGAIKVPDSDPRALHFPHLSKDDAALMAYTQSLDKGERDVKTKIKPGVYLKKYFSDRFSAPEIAKMAALVRAVTSGDTTILHIATTPEECVLAYKACTDSCMSDGRNYGGFKGHLHPASVYGSPDEKYVTVAYLKRGDRITAKALVNRQTKRAQSFHGDSDTLKTLLRAQGYDTSGAYCLNGLLIHAIATQVPNTEDGRLRFIGPCIDGHSYARHDAALSALQLLSYAEYTTLPAKDRISLGYYQGLTR